MEEIKVGDYVRTNYGHIGEVLYKQEYEINWYGTESRYLEEKDIVKHSPYIIDLIEVGDYVNGSKVIDIVQAPVKAIYTEDIEQKLALIPIVNEQIKNIVTKELFNQVKYEV